MNLEIIKIIFRLIFNFYSSLYLNLPNLTSSTAETTISYKKLDTENSMILRSRFETYLRPTKGDIALQLCDQTKANSTKPRKRERSWGPLIVVGGRVHPWRYKWQWYYCNRATAFTVIKRCDRRATRGLLFSADSWLTPTRKKA